MSGNNPRVSIRLGTDGKAQVKQDFVEIGDSGSAQAQRYKAAWERASADAERAIDKQAKAAERLASAGMINPTTGAGYATTAKSAAASASVFTKELERQETEARRLIAAIDPLFAAQERYAAQVRTINSLKAQGALSEQRYQQLLAAEEGELNRATIAAQRHAGANGQMRMGMQQLGFQLGDISTQMAMGTRASVIFAQQSGQTIQALQLMGGEGNKFLKFLGGPWGIALSVAAIALTPLIGKLFETNDAIGNLVRSLKEQEEKTRASADAQAIFDRSVEGSIAKIRDLTKTLDEQNRTLEDTINLSKAALASGLANVAGNVTSVTGQLATALQRLHDAQRVQQTAIQSGNPDALRVAVDQEARARQQVIDLTAQLNGLSASAERGAQALRSVNFPLIERNAKEAVDPIAKINRQYDDMAKKARAAGTYTQALADQIERMRNADIKAEQDRDRKGPNAQKLGGTAIENAQIAAFLDIANRYRGKTETGDKAVLESFFRAANEKLDPEKTAWCAAFVNAVLATGGVKGTGSLAARSFLGFGKDDRSSPQKGDIVIVRSGGSPSGMHVGFLDSIDAKGNVSVLGGNTGNKVGTATFAAKDVLGIRRPPTAGEDMASVDAAAKAAADAASAEAVKQFVATLAASAKADIAAAARPLEDRAKALKMLDEENDRHAQAMTLLQAENDLTGVSQHQREEILRLLQYELDIRRQYPGLAQQEIDKLVEQRRAEDGLRDQIDATLARMDAMQQTGEEIVDTVFNPQNWKDWGDLGKKVLQEILDLWLQMSLINPLKNQMFGTSLPSFGSNVSFGQMFGFLGGLLGGGGGSSAAGAASGIVSNFHYTGAFGGYANGTEYFPGGMAWVGEFGKELVRLPRGSKITPANESRRLEAANDMGIGAFRSGDTYHIGVTVMGGGGRSVAEDRRTGLHIAAGVEQGLADRRAKGLA